MYCVSLPSLKFEELLEVANRNEFIEIRLDLIDINRNEFIQLLNTNSKKIIATRNIQISDSEVDYILLSLKYNVEFIDIDVNFDSYKIELIISEIRKYNKKYIISYHNYYQTPSNDELINILNKCSDYSPDLIKIACKSNSKEDNLNLLNIYRHYDDKTKLIVMGMGLIGKITRIASLYFGAPFVYVSSKKGLETADGQIDKDSFETIQKLLNDN